MYDTALLTMHDTTVYATDRIVLPTMYEVTSYVVSQTLRRAIPQAGVSS
jgi:hypothetical protein